MAKQHRVSHIADQVVSTATEALDRIEGDVADAKLFSANSVNHRTAAHEHLDTVLDALSAALKSAHLLLNAITTPEEALNQPPARSPPPPPPAVDKTKKSKGKS